MDGDGKPAPGEAGRLRVLAAINAAIAAGDPMTVAGIAREAHVNRVFIQKRPGLRELIREHEQGGSAYGAPRPVRLPPLVETLILQELGEQATFGEWMRAAAAEKLSRDLGIPLDELDTARRPAQRRRNYSERQQDGKQRGSEKR